MTHFTDFLFENDSRYSRYLDYGFVGLVETMGSDSIIAQSARVSYGNNNSVTDVEKDTHLLRYMMRHNHTSPFEMGEVRFHLKIPIFAMRQHIRHRTFSTSEYSGRYSKMSDEMYMPPASRFQMQSQDNKQMSSGKLNELDMADAMLLLEHSFKIGYENYERCLELGMSREVARIQLPLANYTELYCKVDLHNFFHYIKLRLDPDHAQDEIVDLSRLMYAKVQPHFPISCKAFEDYRLNAVAFSAKELEVLGVLLNNAYLIESPETEDVERIVRKYKPDVDSVLSKREVTELIAKIAKIAKESPWKQ